ncbi:MAG: FeS-binding protein [Thalassobium sp.]|nr:MAG: FeS-binding protein [Thalassobium sp.]
MGIDDDFRFATARNTVRVKLVFLNKLIKEPLIYEVGQRYDVITNILQANVTVDEGWVTLDINGKNEEINNALYWFSKQGAKVQLTLPI